VSDSKKDLTRIEDLGEYLHELNNDEENFIPDLPPEATSPNLMDETEISDFSSSSDSNNNNFESDVSSFENEDTFANETDFANENSFSNDTEFSTGSEFSSENSFSEAENFGETDDFSTETSFSLENENEESTAFFDNEDSFEQTSETDNIQDEEDSLDLNINTQDDFAEVETTFAEEPIAETIKTPLPGLETPAAPFKEPENFQDLKKFAENSSFTDMAAEGNPSFSVLVKSVKFVEDAQDIILLLKELKLATDTDDVLLNRLSRGELLIPRISEFAATFLAHKLRRFDIDILVGLSDEIHPPKNPENPELGLVSKHGLYQNQAHHFQFGDHHLDISQIIISATPTLDGHQVIKYLGVASEHKMLDGSMVEDENSTEISAHYQELAQKLKAHALKSHANAVVGLNYQLTPLPSQYGTLTNRYRLTCTGNLVWINKI
jgi:uncharacterized protein YbjQ (UPF0145 family)